jgi:hypothetical protein
MENNIQPACGIGTMNLLINVLYFGNDQFLSRRNPNAALTKLKFVTAWNTACALTPLIPKELVAVPSLLVSAAVIMGDFTRDILKASAQQLESSVIKVDMYGFKLLRCRHSGDKSDDNDPIAKIHPDNPAAPSV